jgi:hypothetical protein
MRQAPSMVYKYTMKCNIAATGTPLKQVDYDPANSEAFGSMWWRSRTRRNVMVPASLVGVDLSRPALTHAQNSPTLGMVKGIVSAVTG